MAALASYGPDLYASGRMAARLVDKIIKGVRPAEIPVEVNPKIEFAINLKVAQALGLTIAPEMLYHAVAPRPLNLQAMRGRWGPRWLLQRAVDVEGRSSKIVPPQRS